MAEEIGISIPARLRDDSLACLKAHCQAARDNEAAFDALFSRHIEPIEGTLVKEEVRRLFDFASEVQSGVIVDVGTFLGRSTTSLAYGSLAGHERPIFVVDPHEALFGEKAEDTYPATDRGAFDQAALAGGARSIVRAINASSETASSHWPHPVALLQIDGTPDYDSVKRDVLCWLPHLQSRARVVFCDAQSSGSGRVLNELLDTGWLLDGPRNGALAVIRIRDALPRLPRNWPAPPRAEASRDNVFITAKWVAPRDLLTPQRFDFAAKHIYARLREKGVDSDWGRSVYAFHLLIWNRFFEDVPRRLSQADFLKNFDQIIEATRQTTDQGLHSLVPLAMNGVPVNGAHRIAAALLLGKMVACMKIEVDPKNVGWDHRFFEGRAASSRDLRTSDIFDSMALEFCRMLPNIAIAVKFPAAKDHNAEVDHILSEHAHIFYRKTVTLKNDGPVHLVRTLYEDEPWLGTYKSDFDGARRKARWCFSRRGPVHFFLLAFDDRAELMRAKGRVRDLFDISNNSIHITDTRAEAFRVAKLAFSNYSIEFVNRRSLQEMPNFNRLLSTYRDALAYTEDQDDFCIDGSAVMAAYGIRDCHDIDYIFHSGCLNLSPDPLISSHNEYGRYYTNTLDDIIFDHRNHFYLDGMKFASLALVRDWKRARGEQPKDHADIALIDAWTAGDRLPIGARARSAARRLGCSLQALRRFKAR